MSLAGSTGLVEVYVMRKLYKDKMIKRMEKEKEEKQVNFINKIAASDDDEKNSSGCLPNMFKKIHPAGAPPDSVTKSAFV
ncbi:hypothetical protein LOK49_LG05G02905 [Camellia lanceoleosa]|uniref:Uncharacterized protein n=1 Tax=Camellia lanceoleosa TaxID=1840588 RepID=A0ACC0HV58_9ERIC|nr:hypothetical protein LOK49_LG05G02905 [Camellia lanceoleosa]